MCALECNNTNTLTSSIFLSIWSNTLFAWNIIRQTHDQTYLEYPWLKSLKLSKRIVSHHVLVQGELFKHSLMRVNSMITIVTLLNPPPIVKMESTLLTQIVGVLMQKAPKSTHYLSGFPLFLRVAPPPTLDGGTLHPPDPRTPTRLTNASHLSFKTSYTSAKILWLGRGCIISQHTLKEPTPRNFRWT